MPDDIGAIGRPQMKRLAVIVNTQLIGGHEMQLVHLARTKSRGDVTMIVTSLVSEQFFSEHGFDVRRIQFSRPGKIWTQWHAARQFSRLLQPVIVDCDDFLICGGTIEACIAPARALRILRPDLPVTAYIPMYVDRVPLSGLAGAGYNCVSRVFIGTIDRFITINRIQARLIAHNYRRPVQIVPNVITSIAKPVADHGPRLIFVGRLDDRQKNVSGAIDLLDHADNPFRAFHIYGDGPDRATVEARAQRAQHIDVTFHGWVSHDQLASELGLRDLLLMNSRWEGEPMIVRELASAGIPSIGTDISGFRGLLPRHSRFDNQPRLLAILHRFYRDLTQIGN